VGIVKTKEVLALLRRAFFIYPLCRVTQGLPSLRYGDP
jgi:hypothetical protein